MKGISVWRLLAAAAWFAAVAWAGFIFGFCWVNL